MNRQSQWLFEAPLAAEATHYTNPEYYNDECAITLEEKERSPT
jgi:hypothetical protein